ncbi:MAG: hypothetical protein K1X53_09530 [Candidatus Sumerlaeaceae bacterium]|nr:hypothetical protein [Candidatus Sumerlaeaceae bacterium]
MAKKKQRSPSGPADSGALAATSTDQEAVVEAAAHSRLFSVKEYVILNLVWDAFCILMLVLVAVVLKETRGLIFFFALLMAGFLFVSIFDYAYDRVVARPAGRQKA